MSGPKPHPQLGTLARLLGTWRGRGRGVYPSITAFDYDEEVRFWHSGKPWLGYEQRTWSVGDGNPMHSEVGFWRPGEEGTIEIVIAHAFGIGEVQEGRILGNRVEVTSKTLASTPTANEVKELTRVFEIEGDRLNYEVSMAFGDHPLQNHLTASLERTASG